MDMKHHSLGVIQRLEVRRLVIVEAEVTRIEEICYYGGKKHFGAILNVLCVARENWCLAEAIRLMRHHFLDRCEQGSAASRAAYHETFLHQLAYDLQQQAA